MENMEKKGEIVKNMIQIQPWEGKKFTSKKCITPPNLMSEYAAAAD